MHLPSKHLYISIIICQKKNDAKNYWFSNCFVHAGPKGLSGCSVDNPAENSCQGVRSVFSICEVNQAEYHI